LQHYLQAVQISTAGFLAFSRPKNNSSARSVCNRKCLWSKVTKVPAQIDLSSDKKNSSLARATKLVGIGLEQTSKILAQTNLNSGARFGQEKLLSETVVLTRLDKAVGWARKYSLFPYPFATACCAMEYMSLSMSPYDIDRFGALLPRFSPRQADLLMVIGTVNHKLSPVLKRVYDQMSEPKWVMAFGACAASGGFYDNYATVQGIDRIIPVDVYVPGCPPRPEAVLDGLMELQKHIASQKHPIG
jgi:NADH-quinone oxidoreductase subunit B